MRAFQSSISFCCAARMAISARRFELFLLLQPACRFLVLQFFLLQALRLFLGTALLFQSALLRLERFFLPQAFGFFLLLLLAGLFPQLDLGRRGLGRRLHLRWRRRRLLPHLGSRLGRRLHFPWRRAHFRHWLGQFLPQVNQ